MPHVETTVLAIVMEIVETVVKPLALNDAKARPLQWVTVVAMVVRTSAIVALAIAKALVTAVAHRVLHGDDFHFGWEV